MSLQKPCLHVILMARDFLFVIFWICGVQLRCPSIARQRKLHSVTLNWLWIYCQLRGLRIYIALMIMKKHEYCFLYFKVQLVYMKPFRNAIKLIVNILWYFIHFHVFGRCWVARQTQRTYQICIICIWYSFEIRTGFMNIIHLNDK